MIRETQMVNYPYFVDIRQDGLKNGGALTSGLDQITMAWPSPIDLDQDKLQQPTIIRLLQSSADAWTSTDLAIQPDFDLHGDTGFAQAKPAGGQLPAVVLEGQFESFFTDKPSPFEETEAQTDAKTDAAEEGAKTRPEQPAINRLIGQSPESARIILFASNNFVSDVMLDLAASGLGTEYRKPVDLVQNAIDWSLEDRGLLEIRGRAHFSRVLHPLAQEAQMLWEYLNYGLALLGLLLVWLVKQQLQAAGRARQAKWLAS